MPPFCLVIEEFGLLEFFEDLRLVLLGDAWTGVVHRDSETSVGNRGTDLDRAGVRKLDGIPHKVEQNLGQPALVAPRLWQVLRHLDLESQVLRGCK